MHSRAIPEGPPTLHQLLTDSEVERVLVYCNNRSCGHHGSIPIATLIEATAGDLLFTELVGKLMCSSCGGTDVDPRPDYSTRSTPGFARGWSAAW